MARVSATRSSTHRPRKYTAIAKAAAWPSDTRPLVRPSMTDAISSPESTPPSRLRRMISWGSKAISSFLHSGRGIHDVHGASVGGARPSVGSNARGARAPLDRSEERVIDAAGADPEGARLRPAGAHDPVRQVEVECGIRKRADSARRLQAHGLPRRLDGVQHDLGG